MTVCKKHNLGTILRPVVFMFLLVVLLYWLEKLPGTLSPAEKKNVELCDTAETITIAPPRALNHLAPGTRAILSTADPIHSQRPNYSQGNGQSTGWRREKCTPVSVCCQNLYCRIKHKKMFFFSYIKKILKREIRQLLKSAQSIKEN